MVLSLPDSASACEAIAENTPSDPAAPVDPVEPVEPVAPVDPVEPVAPRGIVNDKTPDDVIETAALLPASPVVTEPIDGATPSDCVLRCMTSILPVADGGAVENVIVVPETA